MKSYYIRKKGRITGPIDVGTFERMQRSGRITRFHEASTDLVTWTAVGKFQLRPTAAETPVNPCSLEGNAISQRQNYQPPPKDSIPFRQPVTPAPRVIGPAAVGWVVTAILALSMLGLGYASSRPSKPRLQLSAGTEVSSVEKPTVQNEPESADLSAATLNEQVAPELVDSNASIEEAIESPSSIGDAKVEHDVKLEETLASEPSGEARLQDADTSMESTPNGANERYASTEQSNVARQTQTRKPTRERWKNGNPKLTVAEARKLLNARRQRARRATSYRTYRSTSC